MREYFGKILGENPRVEWHASFIFGSVFLGWWVGDWLFWLMSVWQCCSCVGCSEASKSGAARKLCSASPNPQSALEAYMGFGGFAVLWG